MLEEQVNVITEQQIAAWKKEYGKIYKTTINEEIFVWRKLKRAEYVDIMKMADDSGNGESMLYARQEKIATITVIYPSNFKEHIGDTAGLATTIADEVILKSGFDMPTTEEL